MYPKFNWENSADHLLFDVGFSTALLWSARELLEEVSRELPGCDLKVNITDWLASYESFLAGRIQTTGEHYAAGDEAAAKGCTKN